MSIRFGGGGAQQDIDGDGGRYRVRSSADASGRAVRALWRAPRSVLGCAAVCGGGQDEFHCGGQVHPPAGVDDVRMGACSGPHPVRDDPLRILPGSARKFLEEANPARRAGVATGGVGEQDPRVDLSLDPRSAAPLCSGRCNAR